PRTRDRDAPSPRRTRRAIRAVGNVLRKVGRKIANSRLGRSLRNSANKLRDKFRRHRDRARERQRQRQDDRRRANADRKRRQDKTREQSLALVVARIRPRLNSLLRRGIAEQAMRAVLLGMRTWYRLSGLTQSAAIRFTITARLNRSSSDVTRGYRERVVKRSAGAPGERIFAGYWMLFLDRVVEKDAPPADQEKKPADPKKNPRDDTDDRWARGIAAIRGFARATGQRGASTQELFAFLVGVRRTFRFRTISASRSGKGWLIHATMNPDNSGNLISITGRVLLVGEGNFTFSEAVVALGLNVPGNITATEAKTEEQSARSDPQVAARTQRLRAQGVTVEFGVEAQRLHETHRDRPKFDNIIWLFPHPGSRRAVAAFGENVLGAFFRSAKARLATNGRITVALIPKRYEKLYRIVERAEGAGLKLVSRVAFTQTDYPGYRFTTTAQGVQPPDVSTAMLYVFTHR
ncbi:hypothetical protein DMH04_42910, partial [Kibdelosporangium aridum]